MFREHIQDRAQNANRRTTIPMSMNKKRSKGILDWLFQNLIDTKYINCPLQPSNYFPNVIHETSIRIIKNTSSFGN